MRSSYRLERWKIIDKNKLITELDKLDCISNINYYTNNCNSHDDIVSTIEETFEDEEFNSAEEMFEKLCKNGVIVYDKLPKDWKIIKETTTNPKGYKWINNGKSRFSKNYKQGLLEVKEDALGN